MGKLENKIVQDIRDMLDKEFPGFHFKVHGNKYQLSGLPDILHCHKGLYIAIEVKRPGKEHEFTVIQKKRVREINNLGGGIAFMATSPEEVRKKLKERLDNVKIKKIRRNKSKY